jgi:PTH1 family peptidyl-tRNA hydrolase
MAIISRSPFNFKLKWSDLNSKPEVSKNISKASDDYIKLIVGVGNIGDKYKGTRHNIAFEVLDEYAKQNNFPKFKEEKKFFGLISQKIEAGQKVILLKPTTLMNLSGKSVQALANFYNLKPEAITIIHDELDLDFGTIKLKQGGEGKSTHNGLKDVSAKLNSNNYSRVRFGIKNELLQKMDAADFVLGKFNKAEQAKLKKLIQESVRLL